MLEINKKYMQKISRRDRGLREWLNNDYGSRLILQLRRMAVGIADRLEVIVPRQGRWIYVVQSGIVSL